MVKILGVSMYAFYGDYFVYLCVYIVMSDYLCVYIVMCDYLCLYIFIECLQCAKRLINIYLHDNLRHIA